MDPDAAWLLDDDITDTSGSNDNTSSTFGNASDGGSAPSIPTGPPVPNPYAHILKTPSKEREYTHWARNKHLQYKYLTEYSKLYYDDYVDYMEKKQRGLYRDVPRPQEWAERSLKIYAKDGERLSANDYKYWFTTKNQVKPKSSIFHAVHSKDYYDRQYKNILC